ncbi:hypothetical protein S245_054590, partial [Arachis hypogaea]
LNVFPSAGGSILTLRNENLYWRCIFDWFICQFKHSCCIFCSYWEEIMQYFDLQESDSE